MLSSVLIEERSVTPEVESHKADAVWWYANQGGDWCGYAGAIPWNFDNALYLCSIIAEGEREDVLFALTKAFIDHAREARYAGCYAMTYEKDEAMPMVLAELGFRQEGLGREWSDNPTIYWFREVKRG